MERPLPRRGARVWATAAMVGAVLMPGLAGGSAAERRALEDILANARTERAAAVEAARTHAQPLLEAAVAERAAERAPDVQHAALRELGAAAGLWLIERLDPGVDAAADSPAARLADEARDVLEMMLSDPLLPPLLDRATLGSEGGRRRALELLGFASDREAVIEPLSAAFERESGEPKRAALVSLVRLGGPAGDRALDAALASSDNLLTRAALVELARSRRTDAAAKVAPLVRDGARAAKMWTFLADYYTAVPAALDAQVTANLVSLVEARHLDGAAAVGLLARMGRMGPSLSKELAAQLGRIERSGNPEVGEAASICLARWGDRTARRSLEKRYDDAVERERGEPAPLVARGGLYLRLGDWPAAAKDLKKALELAEAQNSPMPRRDVWIDLARAYALDGKLPLAASALEKASLTAVWRRRLLDDPDFAELVNHPRHGRVLREG